MAHYGKFLMFPITRILLWLVGAFVLTVLLSLIGVPLLQLLKVPEPAKPIEGIAAFAAMILLARYVERRSPEEAGKSIAGSARDTAVGFLMGAVIFSGAIGAMAVASFYRILNVAPALAILGLGLWHYLWVGVFEEVALRGVVFRILEEWLGSWGALGASALLFGALHLPNQNSSLFAAICIAAEAGVLLGAAFVLTRNVWLAIGIHWAWNFFEGPVFGAAVSGGGGQSGLLQSAIQGPDLWTGGQFGPEASLITMLVATAAGTVMVMIAARRGRMTAPAWRRHGARAA